MDKKHTKHFMENILRMHKKCVPGLSSGGGGCRDEACEFIAFLVWCKVSSNSQQ